MKVLVVGAGGASTAIRALARSPQRPELSAPPATRASARGRAARRGPGRPRRAGGRPRESGVDLVVVGPEAPLVAGLVDELEAAGRPRVRAQAPSRRGSRARRRSPRRSWRRPASRPAGTVARSVRGHGGDRLLPGGDQGRRPRRPARASVIAQDEAEAERAGGDARGAALRRAGRGGGRGVPPGPELSVLALCDGDARSLARPRRTSSGSATATPGPNTGGMGAFSPAPETRRARAREIVETVHQPVSTSCAPRHPFHGVLYAG